MIGNAYVADKAMLTAVAAGMALFCGLFASAAEPELQARVAADVVQPVRPGGAGGQPFWNGNSVWFMHPPSFDFPDYPGCKGYRFLIRDANAKWHEFFSDTPKASLGEVWQDLPVGHTEVRCIAWEGDYHCLQMSSRTFWKMAPYRPGAYPKADKTYLEAAKAGFEYMLTASHMRNFVKTGRPDPVYGHNCYPTKMHSATVRAMVRYAKLAPERTSDAHRLARTAADYLLSVSQPAGAPLAFFPPTYEGSRNTAGKYAGQNMLVYPADAGLAYLELYQATREAKYLKAAENVAATYLRLQGDDGSWYLKMHEKDGTPVNPNRLHPVGVLDFLDALYAETKDICYREAADRAFGYFDSGPLVDWNWEGQFEDVKPSAKFINPSMYFAGSVAIRLLRRWPNDPRRVAQAREILRWIEDQFVCWERPYKDEKLSFVGRTWSDWKVEPTVVEQFHYRQPVDSKAAKVAAAFLAMHRVSGDPLDLAKARTLGDACVRMQHADGRNPTIWTVEGDADPQADWMNCMYETLRTLADLADETGQ